MITRPKKRYRFLILLTVAILSFGAVEARKIRRKKRSKENVSTVQPISARTIATTRTHNDAIPSEKNNGLNQSTTESTTKDEQPLKTQPAIQENNATTQALTEAVAEEETIEFQFENADLLTLVKQAESIFNITFITDEMIQPMAQGGKAIKGNKISFKTNKPLSRRGAWDLFLAFLEIAGFTVVKDASPNRLRIKTIESARKSPLAAYIGTNPAELPDNDEIIRFVYFIQNSTLEALKEVIDPLRSTASSLILLNEHKAFILTDKAYNIKTLMTIVKELDQVTRPQSMSVLKLRRTDAQQVKELYDSLIKAEEQSPARLFGARKQPTSIFFPENTTIIAEPRTNALILLGTQNAIKKIEDFIVKNIDVELDTPYSPLQVYQLKYADATTIADIMNNVSTYGKETEAGKSGGVRGQDKFLKSIVFVPEVETNRLIIKGTYDDYLMAKEIIEKLDEAQPQVAVELLILSLSLKDTKQLGAQLRSKSPGGADGLIGKNIKFQTSGLFQTSGIVEKNNAENGAQRLLGNLVELVTGASAGNTIVTFGQDLCGVWGIFQALQTITNTQIISNPFLVATNKTPATVALGETKRVQTSTIVGTSETATFGDESAKLEVSITPQINSDGMIILNLDIVIDEFINPQDPLSAEKNTKEIKTSTIVADKEVLALGGLIRNKITNQLKKAPVLGDIPLLGWLFKNKSKDADKENLLVLISTRIIDPQEQTRVRKYNKEKINDYYGTMDDMYDIADKHDPIHKLFFAENDNGTNVVDDFLFKRQGVEKEATEGINKKKEKRRRKKRNKANNDSVKNNQKNEPKETIVEAKELPQQLVHQKTPHNINKKIQGKKRKNLSLTNFLSNNEAGSQA
jgi:general secretion pathway protein D